MEKVALGVVDVLRSETVTRWHIVHTIRHQSVAEHSAGVAFIALHICHQRGLSHERTNEVVMAALLHDVPEVLMGDLVPPTKEYLGLHEAISGLESRMTYAGRTLCPPSDKEAADIIKLADKVEALVFLEHNGVKTSAHVRLAAAGLRNTIVARWPDEGPRLIDDALSDNIACMDTLLERDGE